jgi:hypothetical protein
MSSTTPQFDTQRFYDSVLQDLCVGKSPAAMLGFLTINLADRSNILEYSYNQISNIDTTYFTINDAKHRITTNLVITRLVLSDSKMQELSPLFYIDCTINALSHVKNIMRIIQRLLSTLLHLSIDPSSNMYKVNLIKSFILTLYLKEFLYSIDQHMQKHLVGTDIHKTLNIIHTNLRSAHEGIWSAGMCIIEVEKSIKYKFTSVSAGSTERLVQNTHNHRYSEMKYRFETFWKVLCTVIQTGKCFECKPIMESIYSSIESVYTVVATIFPAFKAGPKALLPSMDSTTIQDTSKPVKIVSKPDKSAKAIQCIDVVDDEDISIDAEKSITATMSKKPETRSNVTHVNIAPKSEKTGAAFEAKRRK